MSADGDISASGNVSANGVVSSNDTPANEILANDISTTNDLGNEEAAVAAEASQPQNDIFTAERIVKQRMYYKKKEYLIKWKDYPESANSWEPAENIYDIGLIETFKKELKDFKKQQSALKSAAADAGSDVSSKKKSSKLDSSTFEKEPQVASKPLESDDSNVQAQKEKPANKETTLDTDVPKKKKKASLKRDSSTLEKEAKEASKPLESDNSNVQVPMEQTASKDTTLDTEVIKKKKKKSSSKGDSSTFEKEPLEASKSSESDDSNVQARKEKTANKETTLDKDVPKKKKKASLKRDSFTLKKEPQEEVSKEFDDSKVQAPKEETASKDTTSSDVTKKKKKASKRDSSTLEKEPQEEVSKSLEFDDSKVQAPMEQTAGKGTTSDTEVIKKKKKKSSSKRSDATLEKPLSQNDSKPSKNLSNSYAQIPKEQQQPILKSDSESLGDSNSQTVSQSPIIETNDDNQISSSFDGNSMSSSPVAHKSSPNCYGTAEEPILLSEGSESPTGSVITSLSPAAVATASATTHSVNGIGLFLNGDNLVGGNNLPDNVTEADHDNVALALTINGVTRTWYFPKTSFNL